MGNIGLQWGPIAALVAASGYLLLLVLVARKRGLAAATERWFAAYLVLSAVWTVAWALANQWGWIKPWVVDLGDSIAIYGTALLAPMLAVLTLHFLPRRGTREVVFLGLVWVIAVVLVERGVADASQDKAALGFMGLVGSAGFIIGSLALTALEYVRLRRPLHRNRVLYWLVALVLAAIGGALHYFSNDDVAQFGLLLRLLGATMMTYAIITYSLPDLKSVGRRTLLEVSVTLVRAFLFLAAIVGTVAVFQYTRRELVEAKLFPWFVILAGVATALVLAVLQMPIQNLVAGAAERLLFGPGYDASRALRDYSQSISNILHVERLARVATETIAGALDVDRGALLLITERSDGGSEGRVVPGLGDITAMNVSFAPDSPVLHALRDTQRPLTQYDIDMLPEFRTMDPKERQWQWALNVEVYVPIHAKRTLIGALTLGAKRTGEPYHGQDLDVLTTLAGQTAVALENARLFDDQSRLNQEISSLNEELVTANMRLERLDKAKTDFLNITSHELRTPLTQVRGYADILGEMVEYGEFNQDKMLNISNRISSAADRLEAIYSAMFDVSAIGVDALELKLAPVRPAHFISQAVTKWQAALDQRQETLVVSGIEELPYLEGDYARLVQAFSNLINNAIKFTPDGGRIEIWGRVVQGPEPIVEIVVADTGVGIDPSDHDMIFEKFYRAGSTSLHSTGDTKFMGGGPGLGLPIAKGVVEGHGGRIWVESEGYDREICPGSRFHVLLPLRRGDADPDWVSRQLRKTRPLTGLAKRIVARTAQKADRKSS
jgi:signal transduction histidine kinase